MKMSMDMKLLADGRAIAEGGDSVLVPPGSSGRLEVGLAAPPTAEVRDEKLEILITLEGRTFFELAGIGISARWGGEYA